MFQIDVAKIIGVTRDCICYWENHRTTPSLEYMPKIIQFLGYVPYDYPLNTLRERVITYRKSQSLSQREMAKKLNIDPSTLAELERNVRKPMKKTLEKLQEFLK